MEGVGGGTRWKNAPFWCGRRWKALKMKKEAGHHHGTCRRLAACGRVSSVTASLSILSDFEFHMVVFCLEYRVIESCKALSDFGLEVACCLFCSSLTPNLHIEPTPTFQLLFETWSATTLYAHSTHAVMSLCTASGAVLISSLWQTSSLSTPSTSPCSKRNAWSLA